MGPHGAPWVPVGPSLLSRDTGAVHNKPLAPIPGRKVYGTSSELRNSYQLLISHLPSFPTKETTKGVGRRRRPPPLCGGGRRPPPLWVLVFVYFRLLGYISVLLGHLLTLLPYQLSRQIVYLRASTHSNLQSL